MAMDTDKWNTRYRDAEAAAAEPARVLVENAHLLPASGRALDFACGLAANAFFLAACGLETHAWDSSEVAIEKVRERAAAEGAALHTDVRDVTSEPPGPESFDVIVVSRFLRRTLGSELTEALSPGGLLFYQTFTRDKDPDVGPGNPDYLLTPNELLYLFSPLRVVVYREEDRIGDAARGFRNEAMFVGLKLDQK